MKKDWVQEYLSLVEEEQVREHLNRLHIHASTGPNSLYWGCTAGAEGTGPCTSEASLKYLWKVTATGRGSWGLDKKQMPFPSLRRAQRRIQKTTDLPSSPQSQVQRVTVTCTHTSWCGVVITDKLQGLRPSPLLLKNFIKGQEVVGQECNLRKFADYSKLREALLFRQIWTGWRNGSTETSWKNAKSCTWREINLHALQTEDWWSRKKLWPKNIWRAWRMSRPWASNIYLQQILVFIFFLPLQSELGLKA